MAESKSFSERLEDIIDTGTTIIGAIVGGPTAIRTVGAFTQGVGQTIASPKVSSAVIKVGKIISTAGSALQKYISGGLKATAKATVPPVKAVAKSLPLSKYLAPLAKYVPLAATTYLITAGATKAVKMAGDLKSVKAGILNPNSGKASAKFANFDPLDLQSWIKLGSEIVTFK